MPWPSLSRVQLHASDAAGGQSPPLAGPRIGCASPDGSFDRLGSGRIWRLLLPVRPPSRRSRASGGPIGRPRSRRPHHRRARKASNRRMPSRQACDRSWTLPAPPLWCVGAFGASRSKIVATSPRVGPPVRGKGIPRSRDSWRKNLCRFFLGSWGRPARLGLVTARRPPFIGSCGWHGCCSPGAE